jgi:prolipoprotein diacylglyceryltransferase
VLPSAYGLFVATGCITAVLWLKGRREELGLTENAFWAAMWTMVLGTTIGAKALFVALGWEHYARGELRFSADFRVGLVFVGGLLGATLALALIAIALTCSWRSRALDQPRERTEFTVMARCDESAPAEERQAPGPDTGWRSAS